MQRTLALFKPDVVGQPWLFQSKKMVEDEEGNQVEQDVVETIFPDKSEKMRERILKEGFEIEQERRMVLSLEKAKEFYAEHKGKPFFDELVLFMSSGPIDALVLKRDDAIVSWRTLMGPTNPEVAREQEEERLSAEADAEQNSDGWEVMENWPLRAAFGQNVTRNGCHGSDSEYSALREIEFFFPSTTKWQRSCVVIQPSFLVSNALEELINAFENNGIMICAQNQLNLTPEQSKVVLSNYQDEDNMDNMVEALSSTPCTVLVVEGENVILNIQLCIGPEDCSRELRQTLSADGKNGIFVPTNETESCSMLKLLLPDAIESETIIAIIKPDVAQKRVKQEIYNRINHCDFKVIAEKRFQFDTAQAKMVCENSSSEDIQLLTSGNSIALVLEKPNALKCWSTLAGNQDPAVARLNAPNTLRALYGIDLVHNAVHVPSSIEVSEDLLSLLFPHLIRQVNRNIEQLFDQQLKQDTSFQQVLIEGLTHICKQKPKQLDAIRMLGNWLLENNPKSQGMSIAQSNGQLDISRASLQTMTTSKGSTGTLSNGSLSTANLATAPQNTLPNNGQAIPIPSSLSHTRVIFMLGPPGCGKATQCKLITDEYGFVHISPEQLLKSEVENGSKYGEEIAAAMQAGEMVSPNTIVSLIRKSMKRTGSNKFLIDDFPRDLNQAFAFEQQICACESVINFTCDDEMAIKRSVDNGLEEEQVRTRIASFKERSTPVVDFYNRIGKVKTIDTMTNSIQRVFQSVRKAVEPTVIFVFGGPGAGKSALCKRVEKMFGYVHLSASEILRDIAAKGTEEGQRIKRIIARGQLVPTGEMMGLLRGVMDEHPSDKFILDGFPRSIKQFTAFESQVTQAAFGIYLKTPLEVMKRRSSHLGGFKKRLRVFQEEEMAVVKSMKALGRLREFDASGEEEQVWNAVHGCFKPEIVITLGPPGSNVREHSLTLAKQYGFTVLNEQELMQAEVLRGSREGVAIDSMIRNGQIVPLELKLLMFKNTIEASRSRKFLIEGFPRALDQFTPWNTMIGTPSKVLHFDCDETVCIERATAQGIQDPERKLHVFNTQTLPIVNRFARAGVLKTVDAGADNVDETLKALFRPDYVVIIGKGNLSDKAIEKELSTFAIQQSYELVDVEAMMEEASRHSGTFEGDLARANKQDAVEALLRCALTSSGKRGLLLANYPSIPSQVELLTAALGAPLRVFHITCPSSVIIDEAINAGMAEEEAEQQGEAHNVRVTTLEDPVVNTFRDASVPVSVIQTIDSEDCAVSNELLKPFKPELLVVIGYSGTGRGELATQLARNHGYVHLHTTTLFNEEIERGTVAGRAIAEAMKHKRTIPLQYAIPVIKSAVVAYKADRYIIDGFPRLVGGGFPLVHDQFYALEESVGPIQAVINLSVSDEVRSQRIARADAMEIELADEIYRLQKKPVLNFFRQLQCVIDINADPSPDVVASNVIDALSKKKADEAAELRKLTMTSQDILNEKIAKVVEKFNADQSHIDAVEEYFSQFDMNGDGKLTFGEMMSKMQAWGIDKDPTEYMGMEFQDESIVTKDEWYRFIFRAVFLLDKTDEAEAGEEEDEDEEE